MKDLPDIRDCMTFTTEDSCKFKQKYLAGLQAHLTSSDCNGLWACPLWLVGEYWETPQHETGEVDVFERGCYVEDGYVLSFGSGGSYVKQDAWDEQNQPTKSTNITAYLEFDHSQDTVRYYRCPPGSEPAKQGPLLAQCEYGGERPGYFADSKAQLKDGEAYMWLVSDIFNTCPHINPGCGHANPQTSDCNFAVKDIKIAFVDKQNHFEGNSDICPRIWAHGPQDGRPSDTPPPSNHKPPMSSFLLVGCLVVVVVAGLLLLLLWIR